MYVHMTTVLKTSRRLFLEISFGTLFRIKLYDNREEDNKYLFGGLNIIVNAKG